MEKILKNKKVLIAIVTIILTIIVVGVSYAYFSAVVTNVNNTETVIQTKELSITFDGTQEISATNIVPGWSGEKKFTVENTSSSKTIFNIYMQNITNGFGSELIYSLYETDSSGVTISTLSEDQVMPSTNANKAYLLNDIELNASTKKYYKMVVEFPYKNTSQNDYQNASFTGTLGIDAGIRKDVAVVAGETINASSLTSGQSVTEEIQILNYANESQNYDLKLSNVVNTYASGLTYSLKKNGTQVIASTAMPTTDTVLLEEQVLAAGAKDTYEITITYNTSSANLDGYKLLENAVNTFSAKISTSSAILAQSLLAAIEDANLADGVYKFAVNGTLYKVHYYQYNTDQHWTTNQTFGSATDVATANEEAKNMVVVKVNGDLEIDQNVTVGPIYTEYGGPKGFMLYVTGTLTNNGTIDNSHGAKATGEDVYLWRKPNNTYEYIPALGAAGGASAQAPSDGGAIGNPGEDGTDRQTGGGSSGSAWYDSSISGTGGRGTSYSGGSGGGSVSRTGAYRDVTTASQIGGKGGNGIVGDNNGAGGGAGNPGGSRQGYGTVGANGTGGLLIIYADVVANNNIISANGAQGGSGDVGAGGSSGGGSINIFYKNSITILDQTKITANGGVPTTGGRGGNGSITYTKINNDGTIVNGLN